MSFPLHIISAQVKGMTAVKSYLEVTMKISQKNRPAAAKVYHEYRRPFLDEIPGALTKELLVREEDVQAIHGFDSVEHTQAYLTSDLFVQKVAPGLKPIWDDDPDVRIYSL